MRIQSGSTRAPCGHCFASLVVQDNLVLLVHLVVIVSLPWLFKSVKILRRWRRDLYFVKDVSRLMMAQKNK